MTTAESAGNRSYDPLSRVS